MTVSWRTPNARTGRRRILFSSFIPLSAPPNYNQTGHPARLNPDLRCAAAAPADATSRRPPRQAVLPCPDRLGSPDSSALHQPVVEPGNLADSMAHLAIPSTTEMVWLRWRDRVPQVVGLMHGQAGSTNMPPPTSIVKGKTMPSPTSLMEGEMR